MAYSFAWTGEKFFTSGSDTGANSSAILVSDDGTTWTPSYANPDVGSIYSVAWTGTGLFAVTSNGAYASPNGQSWTKVDGWNSAITSFRSVIRVDEDYFGACGYGCIATSENGIDWVKRENSRDVGTLTSMVWTGSRVVATQSETDRGEYFTHP